LIDFCDEISNDRDYFIKFIRRASSLVPHQLIGDDRQLKMNPGHKNKYLDLYSSIISKAQLLPKFITI